MIAPNFAAIEAASRIRSQAGARVHRLGEPDELTQEATMPTGIYPRKKKAESSPTEPTEGAAKPAKAKPGRKPKAKAAKLVMEHVPGPRFGVFDDGSVTLNLPGCKGTIVPQEAREFLGFLAKIGVKA